MISLFLIFCVTIFCYSNDEYEELSKLSENTTVTELLEIIKDIGGNSIYDMFLGKDDSTFFYREVVLHLLKNLESDSKKICVFNPGDYSKDLEDTSSLRKITCEYGNCLYLYDDDIKDSVLRGFHYDKECIQPFIDKYFSNTFETQKTLCVIFRILDKFGYSNMNVKWNCLNRGVNFMTIKYSKESWKFFETYDERRKKNVVTQEGCPFKVWVSHDICF